MVQKDCETQSESLVSAQALDTMAIISRRTLSMYSLRHPCEVDLSQDMMHVKLVNLCYDTSPGPLKTP